MSTPSHYCTEAIEHLRDIFIKVLKPHMPRDMAYADQVLKSIEASTKFRLPDAGDLLGLDRTKRVFSKNDFDILHVPYPQTTLEYSFAPEKQVPQDAARHVSARRITHVIDIAPGETDFGPFAPMMKNMSWFSEQGGLLISGLWTNTEGTYKWKTSHGCDWEIASSFAIIARDQDRCREFLEHSPQMTISPIGDLLVIYASGMPSVMASAFSKHGREAAMVMFAEDMIDDVHVTLDFMLAMACSNVTIGKSVAESREKLNKKRQRNRRVPFYEYKELQIIGGGTLAPDEGENDDGSYRVLPSGRKSPKRHLRRGHMRNYGPGRRKFILRMVINAGSTTGIVEKDYAVRRGETVASS